MIFPVDIAHKLVALTGATTDYGLALAAMGGLVIFFSGVLAFAGVIGYTIHTLKRK